MTNRHSALRTSILTATFLAIVSLAFAACGQASPEKSQITTPVRLQTHDEIGALVGIIDQDRADQLTSELLLAIEHQHAHTIILDVTGVPLVDTHVAAALMQATDAARLLGAESILVGIRPELAQTIVGLGVDLSSIQSLADLQSGIFFASRRSRARRLTVA